MRFLSDQDVWQATVDYLRAAGYEVQRAAVVGVAQASNVQLLEYVRQERRVLLTRDKGFGSLVLRVTPETLEAVHRELGAFLAEHGQEDLSGCFVVIEPGRHRLRRVPS